MPTAGNTSPQSKTETQSPPMLPLPGPDAEGVILLTSTGPYEAADVSHVGRLVIRGQAEHPSDIVVSAKPLRIWAEQFHIEHVRLRLADESRSSYLLAARTQNLSVANCAFDADAVRSAVRSLGKRSNAEPDLQADGTQVTAIVWKPIDPEDDGGSNMHFAETRFRGSGTAVRFQGVPRTVRCVRLSKEGSGPLFHLTPLHGMHSRSEENLLTAAKSGRFALKGVTLKGDTPLLRLHLDGQEEPLPQFAIDAVDCLLQLSPGTPLIEFVADPLPLGWQQVVTFSGEGTHASAGLHIAGQFDPQAGTSSPLPSDGMDVDGIILNPVQVHRTEGP